MNALLPRFLKSAYRKEPISSFVLLIGAVDVVIGGVDERWSLLTFGLGLVGVAIALRWWQIQQRQVDLTEKSPTYFLPPSSSRPPLPVLSASKRQPPR